jgi:UDP-N-acetylmuramoylalanine--D-glutamate ligase
MSETASIPTTGLLAYLGPPLRAHARLALEAQGYRLHEIDADGPDPELPEGADVFVYGLGRNHPQIGRLQHEAIKRGLPAVTDLSMLGAAAEAVAIPSEKRVIITGSAGKSTTAALLEKLLVQGGVKGEEIDAEAGYLNAAGLNAAVLLLTIAPAHLRYAERTGCAGAVLLNLTEEDGGPVGEKTREACTALLTAASFGILGTDDTGAQSLLMSVRRRSPSTARALIPVSGNATLSDGWFALDRAIYAVRNGRTRRVADFHDSAILLGDHLSQCAAAASALAERFGIKDDHIAKGLLAYRGLEGRFDCIGTEGRIVFVDDRHASCRASTAAAMATCPDVFWIGHRFGDLTKAAKAALRSTFYLTPPDGSGPPVDNVVTFSNAEDALGAALASAQDLLRREPAATPVILFSPGCKGYVRQGDSFKIRALSYLSERRRSHG